MLSKSRCDISEVIVMKKGRIKQVEYEERGIKNIGDHDTLIAGLWYGLNYGSIISAFALYKTLENIGRKPILLNKPRNMWTSHYDNPDSIAGRFIYKNCDVASRGISTEELNQCSYFAAGSDVVWNYELCGKDAGEFFFGDFVRGDAKRISCASSFGKVQGNRMGQTESLKIRKNLELFQGISVRCGYDVGVCQSTFGIHPEMILDPVFLCKTEQYEAVIRTAHFDAKEPYIFTYIKRGNERIKDYIEAGMRIRNRVSRNYIDINRFPESSKELGLDVTFHVMADDWLCSIWNSDFVVTDSYYGVCFAILFHKPFAVITSADFKMANDIRELLGWFGLEERIVPCDIFHDMKDYHYLFRKNINYGRANQKLEELRKESLDWLVGQFSD